MIKKYCTIGKEAELEIIINRSKFIGRAFPVANEDEALSRIEDIREKFPDATHHCYAYVFGGASNIQRFNDDGEPGGTAGMPILQVIQQQGLENVLVIVTRYYGGINLGAGGLVRAYSKSTAEVLQKAGKKEMILSNQGFIEVDYGLWGSVEYFLRQKNVPILNIDYHEKVSVEVMTRLNWEDFCGMVVEITNGNVECKYLDEVYFSWPEGE